MRARKSADGVVANLVRSGRKQPQRFRAGSSASTFSKSALITMSRAAFDRLLREEPHVAGDRPSIRGDREAVAALLALADRARR